MQRGWIDRNQDLYHDHGFGLWTVILRSTGEFVGDCGLTLQRVDDSDTEEIEVGYHIRATLQGNGYATEAASAARDFARDRLGLDRLIALINPANLPSQGVARKIGLKPERHSTYNGRECIIYAGELQSPTASGRVARLPAHRRNRLKENRPSVSGGDPRAPGWTIVRHRGLRRRNEGAGRALRPVPLGEAVLRWNGHRWSVAKSWHVGGRVELTGVTALSPTDVWVFGSGGFAPGLGTWHYNGHTWKHITQGAAVGITMASAVSSSPT
jgi:hypothetical protein